MASFRKILLCYDASREGRRALLQGAELAEKLGTETHLLAISNALTGAGMVDAPSEMVLRDDEASVKEVLREGVSRLKARGLDATGHLAYGRPIEQIPRFAAALGVDLIVIGHRTRGLLARWWAGAGNAQLLDQVTCSILISIESDYGDVAVPPKATGMR